VPIVRPSRGSLAGLAFTLVLAGAMPAFAQTPPAESTATKETGIASVYSAELEGQLTASGQPYSGDRLTAAHRSLPLGTRVRVTDPASGRAVVVVVTVAGVAVVAAVVPIGEGGRGSEQYRQGPQGEPRGAGSRTLHSVSPSARETTPLYRRVAGAAI